MTTFNLTITLSPGASAMLMQLAVQAEQEPADLAASMLTEILLDDALAHDDEPRSGHDPDAVLLAKSMFETGKDTVDVAKALGVPESLADSMVHAPVEAPAAPPPAPKNRPGRPAGAKTDRVPVKKTAAEIRHEARKPDLIVAAKQFQELTRNVPLPKNVIDLDDQPRMEIVKSPRPAPPREPIPVPRPTPSMSVTMMPKTRAPSGEWTAAEDATIKTMRSLHAGPYDIAKALKRDINDVRKRISELWVKK